MRRHITQFEQYVGRDAPLFEALLANLREQGYGAAADQIDLGYPAMSVSLVVVPRSYGGLWCYWQIPATGEPGAARPTTT